MRYPDYMTTTPVGAKIYEMWKKLNVRERSAEWDFYPNFYRWASEIIDKEDLQSQVLFRKDKEAPYSPHNCDIYRKPGPKRVDKDGEAVDSDGCHEFSPEKWDEICADLRVKMRHDMYIRDLLRKKVRSNV